MSSIRPGLLTPQMVRSPASSRARSASSLNRSLRSLTPSSRLAKASPKGKENSPLCLPFPDETAVRRTPVKVIPSLLSPPSSASPSSSSSPPLISPSRRPPLSVRSPNVPPPSSPSASEVKGGAAVDAAKATAAGPAKFHRPTTFHAKVRHQQRRTSPPSAQPSVGAPQRRIPTGVRPIPSSHPRPSPPSRPPPRIASTSPRLRLQLQSLQTSLREERERSAALLAEVERLRAHVTAAEERRRGGGREAEDDVVGRFWHPLTSWDSYDAVNSGPSSASEGDGDGAEGEDDEEEDVEDGEDGEDEDEGEDESQCADDEDGDCHTDSDLRSSSAPSDASPERSSARPSTSSNEAVDDVGRLTRQLKAAQLDDPTDTAAPRRSIELTSLASRDEDEEDEDDEDEEDGEDADASHRSVSSASSHVSQSSIACSESSTPGFHDTFPYERNLYLLSRHYHIHHRLYSCPDAVTFKATHIHSGRPVVIKVSEGFAATRSHPKEVRLITRAQGHGNVMTLRGWWGFEATHCYAFITDFVHNVPIDRMWDDEHSRRCYMRDLLQGLQHLHNRGILYRDIKPSNVLWDARQAKAVIIDFDVATYYDAAHLHRSVVGTTGYMAPEMTALDQVSDKETAKGGVEGYGQQVDVYSAGVVLGQLLFHIHEDEVADAGREDTKGPAMVQRVLHFAQRHGGRIGADYHLLLRMLTPEPQLRITVDEALQHPFFLHSNTTRGEAAEAVTEESRR